jgi:hypothetical protein
VLLCVECYEKQPLRSCGNTPAQASTRHLFQFSVAVIWLVWVRRVVVGGYWCVLAAVCACRAPGLRLDPAACLPLLLLLLQEGLSAVVDGQLTCSEGASKPAHFHPPVCRWKPPSGCIDFLGRRDVVMA